MTAQQRLIRLLADGELHSGSELADVLGVSRTAVWKQLGQLESLEIEISGQAGKGYQLAAPLELLDADEISGLLAPATGELCEPPELLWTSASTNSHLLAQSAPPAGRALACLAEYQSAGRGRRGRQWFAPAGHGICLSVAWQFAASPASLSCLGLAVGIGVLRALKAAGVNDVSLKWPNDLVLDGRKLAGILIDVQGEAGGPLHVVAGVGVNYRLNPRTRAAVRENAGVEPASICDDAGAGAADRNTIAARLIDEICVIFRDFDQQGFAPLAAEWVGADYLAGKAVSIEADSSMVTGTAAGISADGRLRVNCDGRELLLVSGDVRVRADS